MHVSGHEWVKDENKNKCSLTATVTEPPIKLVFVQIHYLIHVLKSDLLSLSCQDQDTVDYNTHLGPLSYQYARLFFKYIYIFH